MATAAATLAILYAALLTAYRWGWRALPEWQIPLGFAPQSRVTVLIPARDESEHLEACLRSILRGNFSHNLLKIIVIDDFSEEKISPRYFPAEYPNAPISILHLADFLPAEARFSANKKQALALGVARATGTLIVSTDADCEVPPAWLTLIVSAFEANPARQFLTAPVAFRRGRNALQHFQSLDFLGLMGITGAGIGSGWQRMANGANLAYRKTAFEAVGGYAGNENVASGDDMFLVQKMAARWPDGVFFLKNRDATVLTEAKPDLRSFWQQRLRWGTKNAALPEWPVRLALLVVFLFCWSILAGAALAAAGLFSWQMLLFQCVVKAVCDCFFLSEMCRYFRREDLLRWFWPSFFLHTLYIALLGTASIFSKKYEWKGRKVA
jgi:cellulose synthase/poly-beta-1,6-N-acetylglucosamine synthase-like glycosyltransferase